MAPWHMPLELKATVLSRRNDPRHGETVCRLTSMRRDEPSAARCKVPGEYAGTRRGRG